MHRLRFLGSFVCFCLGVSAGWAQQSADPALSPLSSTTYAKEADALAARKAPNQYKTEKAQRAYEKIFKKRSKVLVEQLEDDGIVADAGALARCNAIVQRMQRSSPAYPFSQIRVYINRAPVFNAACYGEGLLQVNLGLLLLVANDDELAFVMGHELAHQFLGHIDSSISKKVALETDKDLHREVQSISRSKTNRWEKLRALQTEIALTQGTFNRQREEEADSLGLLLTQRAGYNAEKGALLLLRFQHTDDLFAGGNLYNLATAFGPAGVPLPGSSKTKYNGLSGVKITLNANADLDSLLRTHPNCVERWQKISGPAAGTPPQVENIRQMLAHAHAYRQTAFAEIVRYAFESRHLVVALHFCLLARESGCTNAYFNNMLAASLAQIAGEEAAENRFAATHSGLAKSGSSLKELQDWIGNLNGEAIGRLAAYFLGKATGDNSESALLARALYALHVEQQEARTATAAYLKAYPAGIFAKTFDNP